MQQGKSKLECEFRVRPQLSTQTSTSTLEPVMLATCVVGRLSTAESESPTTQKMYVQFPIYVNYPPPTRVIVLFCFVYWATTTRSNDNILNSVIFCGRMHRSLQLTFASDSKRKLVEFIQSLLAAAQQC